MNLFFLVPYTPTLIRTRPYNLLRGLIKCGHRVTLATLYETPDERSELETWKSEGVTVLAEKLTRTRKISNLLRALPTAKPLQSFYCWNPGLMQQIINYWQKSRIDRNYFDIIHVEHLRGALFGLDLQDWVGKNIDSTSVSQRPPIVWDSVDCISLLFEKAAHSSRSLFGKFATTFDLPRTRRFEGWLTHLFNQTLVTAEADKNALVKLAENVKIKNQPITPGGDKQPRITVLPNGVDLESFTPNYGKRKEATIVLTGKMSYHANVTAALYLLESVMPLVWSERPDAKVQIVGANPPANIRAYITQFPGKVEVTGTVPNIATYLQEATLAVAPIPYGVGIQNKVLEAMACATPTVCSPQAVSALHVQSGQVAQVGSSPEELARAILQLLSSPTLCQSMGAAGRQYVEQNHSWQAVVNQLEDIYRSLR